MAPCSTFRKDCDAELKLHASDDGLKLVVLSFCDQHNHPVSRVNFWCFWHNNVITLLLITVKQELFKQLPQQRRLSQTERQEAENLLSLKANKKMVQDKLVKSTDYYLCSVKCIIATVEYYVSLVLVECHVHKLCMGGEIVSMWC